MATHSSILAWRIPWTEESGGLYSPWGHKDSDTTEQLTHTHTHTHTHNPYQVLKIFCLLHSASKSHGKNKQKKKKEKYTTLQAMFSSW